jgi:hypothetical protein
MLVGRRLFARSDPDATLAAVIDGDIPQPSSENPDVPARLDEVVTHALERDMTARWRSARDMLAALQRYLYSLDETPGPRDVAALVARYCPPETRRVPTHHDGELELPPEITRPRARAASVPADGEPRPGPMTAVIPRDGAAPRGKRQPRARTETFATHVELEELLERGASTAPGSATEPSPAPAGAPHPGEPPATVSDPPAIQLPGRVAPSRGALVVAGLGALGLSVAAVYVFYQGRAAALRPDAGSPHASLQGLDDAAPPGDTAPPGDGAPADSAQPGDAGAPDATAPPDARLLEPRPDAGPRLPRPDAREPIEPLRIDAGNPRPSNTATGTATLTIGANPWGNVLLDGKRIGRTPIEHLTVSAGHHVVEVTFAGEDPPRTMKYPLDLVDGESRDVLADFTRP